MSNINTFLTQAQDTRKARVNVDETLPKMKKVYKPKKKYTQAMCSHEPLANFGVSFIERAMIEAREGIKTIKGVAKDIATKKVYTDPKKNKQWTENLGQGFAEARNRVKTATRKANDVNIARELEKNKSLDLQVDRMRQAAKKTYNTKGAPNLSRSEADGVLSLDKRYKRGN